MVKKIIDKRNIKRQHGNSHYPVQTLLISNMRPQCVNTYCTQSVLYPFIVLAQCFALFPVTGIKRNLSIIRFSWQSKRTIYAVLYIVVSIVNLSFYLIKQINGKASLQTFVALVYFATMLLTEMFFLDLARKWPYLMKKWAEVDLSMTFYMYSQVISHKLTAVSLFVLVTAFSEHALFVASKSIVRENNSNVSTVEIINMYFQKSYDPIFNIIPYNIYIGIFAQIYDIYCVFVWNYRDLFIMLISLTLSQRFTQIVKKVELMSKFKITEESHWRVVREDYVRLTALGKLIDSVMTKIIILSFMHNLFVVLIQFMYTLHQTDQTFIQRFYFVYSFGFLILRTVSVCLFAAEIYHEGRKPLETLTSLSSEIYNIEIERFVLQITIDPPYLSGGEFFIITRSLILSISGAIVTYELVLIEMYTYS